MFSPQMSTTMRTTRTTMTMRITRLTITQSVATRAADPGVLCPPDRRIWRRGGQDQIEDHAGHDDDRCHQQGFAAVAFIPGEAS